MTEKRIIPITLSQYNSLKTPIERVSANMLAIEKDSRFIEKRIDNVLSDIEEYVLDEFIKANVITFDDDYAMTPYAKQIDDCMDHILNQFAISAMERFGKDNGNV